MTSINFVVTGMSGSVSLFLAQVDSSPDIPFLDYINMGVLAIFVYGIIKGWIVTGREKDDIKADKDKANKDKDKAEENLNNYREKVTDEVLPQLFETTRVLGEVAEVLSDVSDLVEELKAAKREIVKTKENP